MTQNTPPQDEKSADKKPVKIGDRIAKVMARRGIASRRDSEKMIEEGRVKLNGAVLTSPAINVTDKDKIEVDGTITAKQQKTRLFRYYKPKGLVTTNRDEKGRDTIFDHLPAHLPRLMSVGRLDLTSEGLLLLTNDGDLKRKLELPSTGWLRKYRVRVFGEVSERLLEPLTQGITIEGIEYLPMLVRIDSQTGHNTWLTIGLREGKNREIRRAMEYLGLMVNRLMRLSYGPFRLGNLQPNDIEEVPSASMHTHLGMDLPADEESLPPASASQLQNSTQNRRIGHNQGPNRHQESRPQDSRPYAPRQNSRSPMSRERNKPRY